MKRIVSFLLIMAMTVSLVSFNMATSFAAEDTIKITDTGSKLAGQFGTWVEYEINGIKCRSDELGPAANMSIFRRLDESQKRLVYNTIHTETARNATFGPEGYREVREWYKGEGNEYKEANDILRQRIAKKFYPDLEKVVGTDKTIQTAYPFYEEMADFLETHQSQAKRFKNGQELASELKRMETAYEEGKECFEKAMDKRMAATNNAIVIACSQATQTLCDILLMPGFGKLTTQQYSGTYADVINFFMQLSEQEPSTFADKLARYKNGETNISFTPSETVRVHALMMDSYIATAEKRVYAANSAYSKAESKYYSFKSDVEIDDAEQERRQQAKNQVSQQVETICQETFTEPTPQEQPEAFSLDKSWVDAETLANRYRISGGQINATSVYNDVLAQLKAKDDFVKESMAVLGQSYMANYNQLVSMIEQSEGDIKELDDLNGEIYGYLFGIWIDTPTGETSFNGGIDFNRGSEYDEDFFSYTTAYYDLIDKLSEGIPLCEQYREDADSVLQANLTLKERAKPLAEAMAADLQTMCTLRNDYNQALREMIYQAAGTPNGSSGYVKPETDDPFETFISTSSIDWKDSGIGSGLNYGTISGKLRSIYDTRINKVLKDAENHYGVAEGRYDLAIERKATVEAEAEAYKKAEEEFNANIEDKYQKYLEIKGLLEPKLRQYDALIDDFNSRLDDVYRVVPGSGITGGIYMVGTSVYDMDSRYKVGQIYEDLVSGKITKDQLKTRLEDFKKYALRQEIVATDLAAEIQTLLKLYVGYDLMFDTYLQSKGVTYVGSLQLLEPYQTKHGRNWSSAYPSASAYFNAGDVSGVEAALDNYSYYMDMLNGYEQELEKYKNASSVNSKEVSKRMCAITTQINFIQSLLWREGNVKQSLLLDEEVNAIYVKSNGLEVVMNDIINKHEGTTNNYHSFEGDGPFVGGFGDDGGGSGSGDGGGDITLDGKTVKLTAPINYLLTLGTGKIDVDVSEYVPGKGYVLLDKIVHNIRGQIDAENETFIVFADYLKNNTEYLIEWTIPYAPIGNVIKSTDYQYVTVRYQSEVGLDAKLKNSDDLDVDTDFECATVKVSNMTEETLSGKYIGVKGYDANGKVIETAFKALPETSPYEVKVLDVELSKPVDRVSAQLIDNIEEFSNKPARIVIKQNGEEALNINGNNESQIDIDYTASVFNAEGELLPEQDIVWQVSPKNKYVSIENGRLTILEGSPQIDYQITARCGETVFDDVIVYVKGDGASDAVAPIGDITLDGNSIKKEFGNVTFDKFITEEQVLAISASDEDSGVKSIKYYLSNTVLNEEDVRAIEDWKDYSGPISINSDGKYILYAQITDYCGNKTYIGSDGMVVEKEHNLRIQTTVTKRATTSASGSILTTKTCTLCGETWTTTEKIYMASSIGLSTTSYTYDGYVKTPTVTVKDSNGNTLVEDRDYVVSYPSGRKNIGTYKVTVRGTGNYEFTKELTFSIKPKDLASTSKVYVSLYGYDDVKVSWNSVSGAGGYYVYYKKSTSSSYSYAGKTTSTSYKVANLTDGASYTFRVYPCVKDGTGKYYKDGSYRTSSSIYTLKKVSSVKAVKSGTKVKVSWSNISGESGYQISRSTSKTGTNIVKTYSTTSGKYYSVSATKGKTYYYKVRAYKTVSGKKIYGPWSTVYKYRR